MLLGHERGAMRARPDRQEPGHRHAAADQSRAASPGAATSASRCSCRWSRRSSARRRRWSSPTCARRPRPGTSCILEARPDWAGAGRAAPRLARQGSARLGRARPEGRPAEGGGGDLVARPRRRLPAGRARAADRLGQGRRAPAAARRPQRPCARAAPAAITLVPTNTLELVEAAAARRAALAGRIEKRATPDKPFDVLVQHLVTIALGGGFDGRRRCSTKCAARLGLPQAHARRVPVGARLRRQGRREPRAPIPSTTASSPTARASTACPTAASRGATSSSRHHRQRRVDAGEVPVAAAASAPSRKASSRA